MAVPPSPPATPAQAGPTQLKTGDLAYLVARSPPVEPLPVDQKPWHRIRTLVTLEVNRYCWPTWLRITSTSPGGRLLESDRRPQPARAVLAGPACLLPPSKRPRRVAHCTGNAMICQEDIESIRKVDTSAVAGGVKEEVLLTFYSAEVRDTVMMSAKNLAGEVDSSGLPLDGVRWEIPPELVDTFRLLSSFGTRLRARHGEGTKRHIKFDDYNASLYTIIKLPGDANWTRVSPSTARRDLDA